MKKILILGSSGRLGASIYNFYLNKYGKDYVFFCNRSELDFEFPNKVFGVLRRYKFDCAINCVALSNIEYCEKNKDKALLINYKSVIKIAKYCKNIGANFIHVSTDYVFDGESEGLVSENSKKKPKSTYAITKLMAEEGIEKISSNFTSVRISWIFGPYKNSFADMVTKKILANENCELISDKFSIPTYSEDFAYYLDLYLQTEKKVSVLNLSNDGECSWYEYGLQISKLVKKLGISNNIISIKCTKLCEQKNFLAERPKNTAMNTSLFTSITGKKPRHWELAMAEYLKLNYL